MTDATYSDNVVSQKSQFESPPICLYRKLVTGNWKLDKVFRLSLVTHHLELFARGFHTMTNRCLFQLVLLLLIVAACRPGGTTPTPTLPTLDVTFELGGQVFSFNKPDLMKNAGMTWVKRQVVYNPPQAANALAPLIQQAHDRGFKILLNVVDNPAEMVADPAGYYAEFATFLVAWTPAVAGAKRSAVTDTRNCGLARFA